jgi:hypothetical protein
VTASPSSSRCPATTNGSFAGDSFFPDSLDSIAPFPWAVRPRMGSARLNSGDRAVGRASGQAPAQVAGASRVAPARQRNPQQILARIIYIAPEQSIPNFCLTSQMGVHACSSRRTDHWGRASTCRSDAESPGAGRAKLRLSRGFSRGPARQRNPLQILARINTSRPSSIPHFCLTMSNGRARRVRVDGLIIRGCLPMPRRRGRPGSGGASPGLPLHKGCARDAGSARLNSGG